MVSVRAVSRGTLIAVCCIDNLLFHVTVQQQNSYSLLFCEQDKQKKVDFINNQLYRTIMFTSLLLLLTGYCLKFTLLFFLLIS